MDKRTFLKHTSLFGLGTMLQLNSFGKGSELAELHSPNEDVVDDYWERVRKDYKLKPNIINLENGYYCIQPEPILKKYFEHIQQVNLLGAFYMRTMQFDNKKAMVTKLAEVAGCSTEELIITRNTTESLDMIISGLDWKPGDEAVMAEQDYGAMLDMFKQVSKRHGTKNIVVSVPPNPKTDEEIVELYAKAITPKTRLLMVCHMINITGHILPVKKICEMAHSKGVLVMVDGAHAFAHIRFRVEDLGCDFYGCSLHKWLSTPLGAGMLYLKKEHIGKIWPLFAEAGKKDDDIARLNHTGTIPVATDLTIADAIDYYHRIGPEKKEKRLRELQQYWTTKVRQLDHIVFNSPDDPNRVCAIGNVGIKGMKPADMAKTLLEKYRIYTVAIDNDAAGVHGCRITPNVYTTHEELDALVAALKEMRG